MFTLCLVDVSTTRTISVGVRIPHRPLPNSYHRRSIPISFSQPTLPVPRRLFSSSPQLSPVFRRWFSMDSFFVNALVRASLCKYHSSSLPSIGCGGGILSRGGDGGAGTGGTYIRNRTPTQPRSIFTSRRTYQPDSNSILETEPRIEYSEELKSELISFTDPYFDPEASQPVPGTGDENKTKNPPGGKQKENVKTLPWVKPSLPHDQDALDRFLEHLEDPKTPLDRLFKSYRLLPQPHIPHLTLPQINTLVSRMMTVPLREEMAMLRYLSILDDMKAANLPISRNEYNAAVSFVARSFKEVTMREAKSAIQLWKESEAIAGVASDTTTFNILLDMASKSDTPVLAEWILREMETRGITPDRFTHTTLITYYGLRGDGEGVRNAYRDLVDAGEIVDTVVLNAVMTALLRAQQPQSAEYIYENMKRVFLDPPIPLPETGPSDWKGKRAWAKNLNYIAARRRVIKKYMIEFNASLAPDVYTFNMMILQSARIGDYDRAMVLFGDMSECSVGADYTIFVALLKGFYWYGGMRYSPWTPERLDSVIKMVFCDERGVTMERSLANWILRSTAKVYNSKERVLRVWEAIEMRWGVQGGVVDKASIEILRSLVGWNATREQGGQDGEGGGGWKPQVDGV